MEIIYLLLLISALPFTIVLRKRNDKVKYLPAAICCIIGIIFIYQSNHVYIGGGFNDIIYRISGLIFCFMSLICLLVVVFSVKK